MNPRNSPTLFAFVERSGLIPVRAKDLMMASHTIYLSSVHFPQLFVAFHGIGQLLIVLAAELLATHERWRGAQTLTETPEISSRCRFGRAPWISRVSNWIVFRPMRMQPSKRMEIRWSSATLQRLARADPSHRLMSRFEHFHVGRETRWSRTPTIAAQAPQI